MHNRAVNWYTKVRGQYLSLEGSLTASKLPGRILARFGQVQTSKLKMRKKSSEKVKRMEE